MGRRALLFGVGAGAAACIACTAILGDFEPTAGTATGGDGGGTDAVADSSDAGPLGGFLAASVSAGEHHTCAVRDGRVFCWGRDLNGQLGLNPALYPNGVDHPTKVSALGEKKGIIQVAAGYNHTCALDGDGSVFCWGANDSGQLGNSTSDGNPHGDPTQVVGVGGTGILQNIKQISAGERNTCAINFGSATVVCWGDNARGQSGPDPSSAPKLLTPRDIGGTFNANLVSAGPGHTCASSIGDFFTCWGTQTAGELGLQSDGGPPLVFIGGPTTTVTIPGAGINAIASGEHHSCAQTILGGTAYGAHCWGDNTFGQVGAPDAASHPVPTNVENLPASGAVYVVTGASFTCALMKDQTVACWGKDDVGQLGRGTAIPGAMMNATPKPVVGLTGVTALSAGFDHACAVVGAKTADGGVGPGQVFCWGAGANNQLGIGPTLENQSTPKLVNSD